VSAIVCQSCGNDLVYVELARGRFDGRMHLHRWVTDWFGCDCNARPRLRFTDTYEIVETGHEHNARVERWGPAA
jgi:hypothetical protein